MILTMVSDVADDYFTLLQLDLQLQTRMRRSRHRQIRSNSPRCALTTVLRQNWMCSRHSRFSILRMPPFLTSSGKSRRRKTPSAFCWAITRKKVVTRGLPLVAQPPPPEVPPGLPSSVIERRPDIREAEQNLVAANAEIGVAKAAFFPQISLTGSGGGSFGRSSAFSSLMTTQLGIWSSCFARQVSQPIFTGGALRGNLRLAESEHQQALIAYRQTIQRAFGDVSDALIGYQKFHQVRVRLEDTVADLQESVRLSNMRYKGGTTTYLEVLDGQRSLFSAELTLAEARGNEYQSLVQFYRALGGGWQQ